MNIKVVSAIFILCLVWGSLWGLVKFSLQIFPPFLFISVRLILAAIALAGLQLLLGRSILPARHEWKKLITISLMTCIGFYATQTFAMQFVDSGLSAVLVFTMPIFIAILGHYILKEQLNTPKWIGLVLGTLGLIAILWPQLQHLHLNITLIGQALLIMAGFFWALCTVYIKKNFAGYDKLKLTIWQMFIGEVIVLLSALIFEPVDFGVWLNPVNDSILFYVAVIGTGGAFVCWNWIVSQVDAFVASISVMCVPILSLLFGAVLWHEKITINIMIGAALICAAMIFSSLNLTNTKKEKALLIREQQSMD